MEIVYIIAGVPVGVMLAELLLPTGGVLAVIGAAGLVAAGVIALGEDSEVGDYVGPGLITIGVLSAVTTIVIGRKVLSAHETSRSNGLGGAGRAGGRGARAARPRRPDLDRGGCGRRGSVKASRRSESAPGSRSAPSTG